MILTNEWQQKWHFLSCKKVYLACSGGVDSMVLCYLLKSIGADLHVLHLNYKLRDRESDLDEKCVIDFCIEKNIPFSLKQVDTKAHLKEHGGNLQDVARQIRYNWFSTFVKETDYLALGHHEDDQIETFLLALGRKSGMFGLSCMLEIDKNKIRPLLHFSKKEIYNFAKLNKIPWREDQSNTSLSYARNKIRNIFLPELKSSHPNFTTSVLTLISVFQETRKELETSVKEIISGIQNSGFCSLTLFEELNDDQKRSILHALNIELSVLESINKLKNSEVHKKVLLDFGEIKKVHNGLVFSWLLPKKSDFELNIQLVSCLPIQYSNQELFVDADLIKGKLNIRNWDKNDKISSIGVAGKQKIAHILKDAKIPIHLRENIQVVCDDEEILWCVGLKISRNKLATLTSKKIFKVTVEELFNR